jgi:hypothetical protein
VDSHAFRVPRGRDGAGPGSGRRLISGAPPGREGGTAMPKRWKVAAVVTLTEMESGDQEEPFRKEREYDDEAKARRKFDKVKDKVKQEMDRED